MDVGTLKDIKKLIDSEKITDITDLQLFCVNTDRLDIYAVLHDTEIQEIFVAYIEKKNSLYNKMLIKRFYENLQNSLIY